MLIGHDRQKKYFVSAIKNDHLSQGYIFVGPEHLGKFSLAKKLAYNILFLDNPKDSLDLENKLSSAELKKMDLCADYLEVSGEEEIKIDDIRGIKNKILQTSFSANKVVVVKKIERINTEAGNALLKIIEEPRGNTHFIFTSSKLGGVMPTIFSRLVPVYFNPLTKIEVKNHLINFGQDNKMAEHLSSLSGGQIGLAVNFLKNVESLENFKKNIEKLRNYLDDPLWKRALNSFQDNSGGQMIVEDWMRFLEYALRCRFLLKDFFTDNAFWQKIEVDKIKIALKKIHRAWFIFSQTNANKRLLFEELVLNL